MTPDQYTMITGTVTAAAAIGGVIVAGLGLRTWQKQLKGTTEYDLARRLMLQVYRVREAIGYVRQPFLSVAEAGEIKEGIPWEIAAYENRWKRVQESMADLQAVVLECEVLWGKEIVVLSNELGGHVRKLLTAVDMFIMSKRDKGFEGDFTLEQRNTLYGIGDDEYGVELKLIVDRLEDYAKPHIRNGRKSV